MTVSSTLEMKRCGRQPSSAPAAAAAKVPGIEPVGEREKARLSNIVQWCYGAAGAPSAGSSRRRD
jgi:hypothetical protein